MTGYNGEDMYWKYEEKIIRPDTAELQVLYLPTYDIDWGPLQFAKDGDACFDLRVTSDVVIHSGCVTMIGTGIKTAFAPEYVLHIYPRSGIAINKQITLVNSPAVIDSGYRGEIILALINLGISVQHIEKGTRVAQARLANIVPTIFNQVSTLDDTERGEGGFGHTGYK